MRMTKSRNGKAVVKTESAFYAQVRDVFVQARQFVHRFCLAFRNCHTLCDELSWSHYRLLISVENEEARAYYLEEARKSLWSVRERTAIEDAQLVTKLDSGEVRRIKKASFCVGVRSRGLV